MNKVEIFMKIFAACLQYGGLIGLGFLFNWYLPLFVLMIIWGHNVDRHGDMNRKFTN